MAKPDLLPGDTLVYTGWDPIDLAIRCHTFSAACHVEFYIGNDQSIAARAAGVKRYPLRWQGLYRVYRPSRPLNMDNVLNYFYRYLDGQGYDWLGVIFGFFFCQLRQNPSKKFCSETQTLLYRADSFEPFQPDYVPDRVPPMLYTASAALEKIWP
jgi:hypothetical protein